MSKNTPEWPGFMIELKLPDNKKDYYEGNKDGWDSAIRACILAFQKWQESHQPLDEEELRKFFDEVEDDLINTLDVEEFKDGLAKAICARFSAPKVSVDKLTQEIYLHRSSHTSLEQAREIAKAIVNHLEGKDG